MYLTWKSAAALLLTIAIWTAAGYRIGLTKGKGWRGAIIDNHCVIICRGR